MIGKFLQSLVSPVTNTINQVSNNSTRVKELQIERLIQAEDKVAEWELIQAEKSQGSITRKFWTIILAIPMMLAFYPPAVPHITAGFNVIADMPLFYQVWLGIVIMTPFGVRVPSDFSMFKKNK